MLASLEVLYQPYIIHIQIRSSELVLFGCTQLYFSYLRPAVLDEISLGCQKITLPCLDLNPGPLRSPVHKADDIPMCHHASMGLIKV